MSDDNYTRCGTPLVYAGQLKLQPEILAELGEQMNPEQADEESEPID